MALTETAARHALATGTAAAPGRPAAGSTGRPDGPADPYDHRFVVGASGLLGTFNAAGVLAAADVHVAIRLGRLGGEADDAVLLALALAVRGVRLGSVCVELAAVHRTVLGESDEPQAVAALPWPDPDSWHAACARSPLVTEGPGSPSGRPARLVGGLLYLERYWRQEEQVREELERRSVPIGTDELDLDGLRAGLARYFPQDRTAPPGGTTAGRALWPGTDGIDRQRLAAAVSAVRRVSVLAGGPGTGKTTTVARLLARLVACPPPGGAVRSCGK